MEKKLFAFEESFTALSSYEKLNFSIQLDDAANGIYYVEADLGDCDWLAVLALLEDCRRLNLQPLLQFGEECIMWEDVIRYVDEKAADELAEIN